MSGGVDSSVAAALLKEQGYQVIGVTMKIWGGGVLQEKGPHHGCYGPEEAADIEDAHAVAQNLGIPFHVIDLTGEYKAEVLDYFCDEYLSGRTPNPCTRCNPTIKFGALIEKARRSGLEFDYMASGHYARVEYDEIRGRYLLKKAKDTTKDQSYFLSFLSQDQLRHLVFPLGAYTKVEVREMAKRFGLLVAAKPDSQNFISGDYTTMFGRESHPGSIVDKTGKVVGRHRGIQFYTIGQHKGLGLTVKEPLYVTALDPANSTLTVGTKEDLLGNRLVVSDVNWIAIEKIMEPAMLKVKIRSSHREAEATITPIDDGNVRVDFKKVQMSITPGQTAVFYQDDTVVGGGIIK